MSQGRYILSKKRLGLNTFISTQYPFTEHLRNQVLDKGKDNRNCIWVPSHCISMHLSVTMQLDWESFGLVPEQWVPTTWELCSYKCLWKAEIPSLLSMEACIHYPDTPVGEEFSLKFAVLIRTLHTRCKLLHSFTKNICIAEIPHQMKNAHCSISGPRELKKFFSSVIFPYHNILMGSMEWGRTQA